MAWILLTLVPPALLVGILLWLPVRSRRLSRRREVLQAAIAAVEAARTSWYHIPLLTSYGCAGPMDFETLIEHVGKWRALEHRRVVEEARTALIRASAYATWLQSYDVENSSRIYNDAEMLKERLRDEMAPRGLGRWFGQRQ